MPERTESWLSRWPILLAVCAGLIPIRAAALEVHFSVEPRILRVGEAATANFTVHGLQNAPPPDLPLPDGIQISGPTQERRIQFLNGQMQSWTVFSYRLIPLRTGKMEIGPIRYTAQGRSVEVPAVAIRVLSDAAGTDDESKPRELSDLLFARMHIQRNKVYNQEIFDLELALYVSPELKLGRELEVSNLPESGLIVQPFQELRSRRESVGEHIFHVRRFRTKVQALTAGAFQLAPTLEVVLRIARDGRRRSNDPFSMGRRFGSSIFDEFFSHEERQAVRLDVEPLELVVLPLPEENRPANFSGAVGKFSVDVVVEPAELTVGDPVTIKTRVAGKGNIENVAPPEILLGEEFKIYEPKLLNKDVRSGSDQGSKVFEQVVIPKSAEITGLPQIQFSYFDPEERQYRTITRGPFELNIKPSPMEGTRVVRSPDRDRATASKLLGKDIAYLKPAPRRWHHVSHSPWYLRPAFVGIQVAPPLVLAIVFLTLRRRAELERDVGKARRLRAPKTAKAALARAKTALEESRPKDFFDALGAAVANYFGDRLNLAPGQVTPDTVLAALRRSSLDPEHTERLQNVFAECERHRFGFVRDAEAYPPDRLRALLTDTQEVLKACERVRMS